MICKNLLSIFYLLTIPFISSTSHAMSYYNQPDLSKLTQERWEKVTVEVTSYDPHPPDNIPEGVFNITTETNYEYTLCCSNLNLTDRDGNTALHIAAKDQDFESLKKLLIFKVNPNAVNRFNKLPLHMAAEFGSVENIKILSALCSINHTDSKGKTPAYHALHNGHASALKTLIECKANLQKPEINSLLYEAADKLDLDCLKVLINACAIQKPCPEAPLNVAKIKLKEAKDAQLKAEAIISLLEMLSNK